MHILDVREVYSLAVAFWTPKEIEQTIGPSPSLHPQTLNYRKEKKRKKAVEDVVILYSCPMLPGEDVYPI